MQRAMVVRRATIGFLTEDLGGGVEGRFDKGAAITVRLLDGELESVSRARLLNGANAAAIRSNSDAWEIVQFEEAEEIAGSVWRLGTLLRGQLGTNDAMAAGAAPDAPFVLLDEAVAPAALRASETGLALNWRVGPTGHDFSDATFATMAQEGGVRALLPLSPVHLRATFDPSGDLELSWIRRGRVDADSWLAEDIPLGEAEEAYRVTVAATGSAVVRTETVSAPGWTYGADEIAADFPDPPAALDITVAQIGALGAGTPATIAVPLP